jgi:hypothetical protein
MAQNHPYLEFAQRHSSAGLSTLNAFAAISRIHNLLFDLDELDKAIKLLEASGESKGRRHSWFEITSYYPVALVTCLEWHARSRMVDLFKFRPSCISADDLKGEINNKLLSQMVAQGVTVPQLMGAMTTVGSAEKYITVLQRLFTELAIKPSVRDILNPIILVAGHSAERHDALQEIFNYRNSMVHEIDFSVIGPWLVRSGIDVDEARERCNLVLSIIEATERHISENGPSDFPNRLNAEFSPVDELDLINQKISNLESEITEALRKLRSTDNSKPNLDDWIANLEASRKSQQTEFEFIERAEFIPRRHFNFGRTLQIALRQKRLEYLTLLRAEM